MNLKKALALNEVWHSRLPLLNWEHLIIKHGIAFGATFQNKFYAVAIWSTPVARHLDNGEVFELRRMAICDDAPKNTASRMLKVMKLHILKHLPQYKKLISYQDTEVHTGTIYKASGWTIANISKTGKGWHNPEQKIYRNGSTRTRSNVEQSTAPKARWELTIRAS